MLSKQLLVSGPTRASSSGSCACDYYAAFAQSKIVWPDISKLPRFSWEDIGLITNTGYIIPGAHPSLLALLSSRVMWFAISQSCQSLRLRAGLWQFRLLPQFIELLPVPALDPESQQFLGTLAKEITDLARVRYDLDQRGRERILTDLTEPNQPLNQKLTRWRERDFLDFRTQVKRYLMRDIPVAERDQWQTWLDDQRQEHDHLTEEIVRLETYLNDCVYQLFDLTQDKIDLIEEVTKHQYGEA